jgi:peptidoglycan-N-acetylglucosamine deacetylase
VHDRLTDRLPAEDQHLKVWRAAGLLAVDAAVSVSPGPLTAADLWAASRVGRPVLWTAWGRDWSDRATPASVLGTVTSGKVDGGTVLLHDSDCTSAPGAWRSAYGALPALFAWCADRGLTVGPLGIHYGTG